MHIQLELEVKTDLNMGLDTGMETIQLVSVMDSEIMEIFIVEILMINVMPDTVMILILSEALEQELMTKLCI